MVPTQLMPGAVTVLADPGAQPLHLDDERLSIESSKIFVHTASLADNPNEDHASALGRSRAMVKRWLSVALVASCFCVSPSTRAQSPTTVPGLVGSWTILNAERVDEGAPVPNARGLLIFDSAGHVVEVVTRGRRLPYAENPPTPEEALGAFTTFGGFWGTFRADEKAGRIGYRPRGAVNPNLMGQELVRDYELKGDRLVITSRAGDLDAPGPTRSTWQRIPPIENLSPTYRKVIGFWQWMGEKNVATATGATITEGKRDPSIIVHSPAGLIGVHFVPANRKRLAGPTPTPEEARASIAGYVGYTAVLNVHPGEVIHHQLLTINPGGGNLLRRSYEFVGDEIHLKFPPTIVQGQERQTQVTLRRLSGEAEMLGR